MNLWFEGEKEGETLSIRTKSLLKHFDSGIKNMCQLFNLVLQTWACRCRDSAAEKLKREEQDGNKDDGRDLDIFFTRSG